MGVFNGNSIYNEGGSGGGGAKSGGTIPDSDFMEISNNLIYSYKNESRNDLNFYFGQNQDSPYSATIEIENNINSSIHVYALNDNGILVELGYIGSNSLLSGNQYTITILGNSYVIEEVYAPVVDPDNILVLNEMDNKIYPCTKINGIYWATEDFKKYCKYDIVNTILYPWRVPTYNDFYNVKTNYPVEDVTSVGGWENGINPPPNNSTKLSFSGNGYKDENDNLVNFKKFGGWWIEKYGGYNGVSIYTDSGVWITYLNFGFLQTERQFSLRLIYDP